MAHGLRWDMRARCMHPRIPLLWHTPRTHVFQLETRLHQSFPWDMSATAAIYPSYLATASHVLADICGQNSSCTSTTGP